ncbi:MAG: hypothetical protein ACETV1_05065 [Candidatus Bathyarchaeia archaeon]
MVKKTAVYGTFETKEPIRQRYWIRRKDGVKQRYWKKTKRMKKVVKKGRYEFRGKGKDLYRAVVKSRGLVPKGYVDVRAEEFLEQPEKYGQEGKWIDWEVES